MTPTRKATSSNFMDSGKFRNIITGNIFAYLFRDLNLCFAGFFIISLRFLAGTLKYRGRSQRLTYLRITLFYGMTVK